MKFRKRTNMPAGVKRYTPYLRYDEGERIMHPLLGEGIVMRSARPRVEVFFEYGLVPLEQDKAPSELSSIVWERKAMGYTSEKAAN